MNQVYVLCARNFTEEQLERLRQVSPGLVIVQEKDAGRDRDAVTRALAIYPQTQVLYTTQSPTTLEHNPELRWVQVPNAGVNHLMGSPLWESPITLTNGRGLAATTIAEYVLGSMFALSRRFVQVVDYQRASTWSSEGSGYFIARELRGSTLGIVGYGSIGREIARLAHGCGMRVLAVKRSPENHVDLSFRLANTGDPEGAIPQAFYGPSELKRVLKECDYIVLTVPLTADSRRLIAENELRVMQKHAYLINVARGEVLDQEALARALQEEWIAGAALDVFETEPLPANSPLWLLKNAIITPHVSGPGPRYNEYAVNLFAENLRRYVSGEPLLNAVDRQRSY